MNQNILVTGGAGYLGSILVGRLLQEKDNTVDVLDCLVYGCGGLVNYLENSRFRLIRGTILDREHLKSLLKNHYDCVIHLASLVGEPLCASYPKVAMEVNVQGTKNLLEACKKAERPPFFLFSSTCSTYGVSKGYAEESSVQNPVGVYGESKVLAEKEVMRYPNHVIFRNATLYGLSARMRLDIIPNQWVRDATLGRDLEVFEPEGLRPFIHIQDCAEYFAKCIESSRNVKRKQVFNIGECNTTKRALALVIQEYFPDIEIKIVEKGDKRSYSVDFIKAKEEFGYFPKINLYDGIKKLKEDISCIDLDNPIYDNLKGFKDEYFRKN